MNFKSNKDFLIFFIFTVSILAGIFSLIRFHFLFNKLIEKTKLLTKVDFKEKMKDLPFLDSLREGQKAKINKIYFKLIFTNFNDEFRDIRSIKYKIRFQVIIFFTSFIAMWITAIIVEVFFNN